MNGSWYLRRLSKMSSREAVRRVRDLGLKAAWRIAPPTRPVEARGYHTPPSLTRHHVDVAPEALTALVAAAESLLANDWQVLGASHPAAGEDPNWFVDPSSGVDAPTDTYAFAIDHRSPGRPWNSKLVWELSRHQHLTLLAAAYHLTGDERYARRVRTHLRSWWEQNPFLRGVHWTSGLEVGLRLVSWVWIRRLLDAWPAAADLFERNPAFVTQLHRHQLYLSRLPSHGSSANNHLVGEAAGSFMASVAFPLFDESSRWRDEAAAVLAGEAARQTFQSGWNRELATGYHAFVLELLLAAACEGEASGHPLEPEVWTVIVRMTDAVAATVDVCRQPPRQGDDDGGVGLLLDAPGFDRWQSLLATGARLFGTTAWWPKVAEVDVRSAFLTALVAHPLTTDTVRPRSRPTYFADMGMTLMRARPHQPDEIWVRCDAGPHGFGSLAGHAHADALSVEIRHGGVEIATDPGTYTYEPGSPWRSYFRSTIAHNTLELDGRDQSAAGGTFLWTDHAESETIAISGLDSGDSCEWLAHHRGYGVTHRRHVTLDRTNDQITIRDELDSGSGHPARLAFHLGPRIRCRLQGSQAVLEWSGDDGPRSAVLELPSGLQWESFHGSTDPIFGWYSRQYGHLEPATSLVGSGTVSGASVVETVLRFDGSEGTT